MRKALAALFLASIAMQAAGDERQWPPPGPVAERIKALQQTLGNAATTAREREAARRELANLLKSPAGRSKPTMDEKPMRPARAAIDPFPGIVTPTVIAPAPAPPAGGVARLEVVEPPRPIPNPHSGVATTPPVGKFAVDPKFAIDPMTGAVLHEVPGGFVDPKTGQFVPR